MEKTVFHNQPSCPSVGWFVGWSVLLKRQRSYASNAPIGAMELVIISCMIGALVYVLIIKFVFVNNQLGTGESCSKIFGRGSLSLTSSLTLSISPLLSNLPPAAAAIPPGGGGEYRAI